MSSTMPRVSPLASSVLSLVMLIVASSSCSDTGGTDSDGGLATDGQIATDGGGGQLPPLPAGVVAFKQAGQSEQLDFGTGDEQFLIVPYSVSQQAAEAIEFTVNIEAVNGTGTQKQKLRLPPRPRTPLWQRRPELWRLWQRRIAGERWRRKLAERVARMPLFPAGPPERQFGQLTQALGEGCSLSSECTGSDGKEVCHQGKCENSLTLDVSELDKSRTTITAGVQRKGSKAAILVESGVTVDAATLDQLLSTFEDKIYPRDVALFGDPPLKTGESTLSSDRNGDGLVWVVLTGAVQSKGVGLFVNTDFVPKSEEAASNEADILYVVPPGSDADATFARVVATMAHELQHLLNFANKVYRAQANGEQGALETLWLDEGLSHFAEDACGYGGENVTLLDEKLFSVDKFGVTALIPALEDVSDVDYEFQVRAMSLMFVQYLFQQEGGVSYGSDGSISDSGGAAWLHALLSTQSQGAAAVEAALGVVDFAGAFDRWIATVALDGRGVTDAAALSYRPIVIDPTAPGNEIGLRVRGDRKDLDGQTVTLTGPTDEDIDVGETVDTLPNTSGRFFLLQGRTGTVKVTVSTQDNQDFRFAVIQVK